MAKRQMSSQEIGSISRSLFNRLSDTEYLSLLTWPNSTYIYDKMRRSDSQVQALLYCMELPIRSTRWYVEPWDKNNPKDVQIAEFIEENLFSGPPKGMTIHWDDFLRLALLMLPFGFSAFEKVYEVDTNGYAKWRKFAERPHETIKDFKYDERGGPLHVEQYVAGASFVEIPIDSSLIFTHRKEGGRLHGISVLRAAYKHWFIKDFLLKITNIGIEKNHVGTPVTKLPAELQDGDREVAEKITRNLRSGEDAGVVLPHGFELEMFEGKRVAIEVLPYIRYQDEMIAKAGLAQFLQAGTGNVGSFALAKDQSDFFLMALNAQSKYICDVINSYAIPQLVDLNWDVEGYPYLKHDNVGGRNTDGIINGTKELVSGSIILPDNGLEEFMRDLLGLPEIDKKTTRGGPMAVPPGAPTPPKTPEAPEAPEVHEAPLETPVTSPETKKANEAKRFTEITWRRDLTTYEKRINLAEIDQKFDTAEAEFVAQGLGLTLEQLSVFLTQAAALAAAGKWDEIAKLTVDGAALTAYTIAFLANLFGFGAGQAAGELDTEAADMPESVKQITALKAATVTDKVLTALKAVAIFELVNAVESGQKPKDAVKDIKKTLENVAKKDLEGHATVQTAWGVNAGRDYVAGEAGVKRIQYSAILDRRTCFPAGTMIITDRGERKIEDIYPGDMVLTRKGFRTVEATSKEPYGGRLVKIITPYGEVVSTEDHPFWIERKGCGQWLSARDINIGDMVRQSCPNQLNRISDGNFTFQNSDYSETIITEIGILPSVSLGISVPVISVSFQDDSMLREKEINTVSTDFSLLNESESKTGNCIANRALKKRFAFRAPIAREGAELAVGITRHSAKKFSTGTASLNNRRAATFLGAVTPILTFSRYMKQLSTTLTRNIDAAVITTLLTANRVPIGIRHWDRKLFTTNRAYFSNLITFLNKVALVRTKLPTPTIKFIIFSIKRLATFLASKFSQTMGPVFTVTCMGTEFALSTVIGARTGKDFATFNTRKNSMLINNSHIQHSLTDFNKSYHESRRIVSVYNLQVNDDPTYYANRILVHNCALCKKLDGMILEAGTPEAKKFKPPIHSHCRCIYAYVLPEEQPQPKVTFVPPPDDLIEKHGHLVTK